MSADPWLKFYPADWRGDANLRLCSRAARGTWIDMLTIMHEATPYGELRVGDRPLDAKGLAKLLGESVEDIESDLAELEQNGVFSRRKNGTIYSRRMEKDENRRRKMRENGEKGGNPTLGNKKENRGLDNQGVKPKKPEARSQKPEARKNPPVAPPDEPAKRTAAPGDPDWIERGNRVLEAAGINPASWTGHFAELHRWIADGIDLERTILPVVAGIAERQLSRDRRWRPASLRYFDRAIREAHAEQPAQAPPPAREKVWRGLCLVWLREQRWGDEALYGPPPTSPDCRVPDEIRAEFPALFQPAEAA